MPAIVWPVGRYTLLEKSYIAKNPGGPHEVLDAGAVVVWAGKPGPHMQPMDDGAKKAVALAEQNGGLGFLDPTSKIELIQSGDTTLALAQQEIADLRARLAQLLRVDMSMASEPLKNEVREVTEAVQNIAPPAPPPPPPPPPPP